MKTAARVFFIVAGLSAVITLIYLVGRDWNALLALIIGAPTTLILLAVGLILQFASATKVPGSPRLKLGVTLLVLSAATWFYVFYYLREGSFFIPFLPQIFGTGSLIAGAILTFTEPQKGKKHKVTPTE